MMHWLVATIRMYHSQARCERKRDKAVTVRPQTDRAVAKEALARAMLGKLEESEQAQHKLGHPIERRWVYRLEEEEEVPLQYADQADIRLPGIREEAAVDKKREDFSWLEEAIEQQRSRESYEREFGSSSPWEFGLMEMTKEEGDTEAEQRKGEGSGGKHPELNEPRTEAAGPEAGGEKGGEQRKAMTVRPQTDRAVAKEALARAMLGKLEESEQAQHKLGHPIERRWVYRLEEEEEVPLQYADQADIRLPGIREEVAVDKKREDFSWLEEAIEQQRNRESYEREFGSSSPWEFGLMEMTKEEGDTEAEQRKGEGVWGQASRAE
ncbi:unnamed protein product [Closterium sp. Naga37s-1]|nr:unnamed protein product [Closterium sp. Naga37s-1]